MIIIDNASTPPLNVDLSWCSSARIVREDRLGLVHARLRSFAESCGEILVFVDDDNVLDPEYLQRAHTALTCDDTLGAIGGRVIPRYEAEPPSWFATLGLDLACRDLGNLPLYAKWDRSSVERRDYPVCAPIGAGLVIRRSAYADYVVAARSDEARTTLGRKGSSLASGEDNDMVMILLAAGWRVAYLPELRLEHLIPARRLTSSYLAEYAYSTNLTWVQVLDLHGLRPWGAIDPWTAPLRKAKAYATFRAWRDDANFIRWRAACGLLDGRARLEQSRPR
jgi:glycosyltransferase involved in cell wall biosynthesis